MDGLTGTAAALRKQRCEAITSVLSFPVPVGRKAEPRLVRGRTRHDAGIWRAGSEGGLTNTNKGGSGGAVQTLTYTGTVHGEAPPRHADCFANIDSTLFRQK